MHGCGVGVNQGAGRRGQRRANGHDIIGKRDAPTVVVVGGEKCAFDVGLTRCCAPSLDLATVLVFAGELGGGERQFESLCDVGCYQQGLVAPALA